MLVVWFFEKILVWLRAGSITDDPVRPEHAIQSALGAQQHVCRRQGSDSRRKMNVELGCDVRAAGARRKTVCALYLRVAGAAGARRRTDRALYLRVMVPGQNHGAEVQGVYMCMIQPRT